MEPTFDALKEQIISALARYTDDKQIDPKTAMLSGMSLAATFLAKCDGSKTMTAATVVRAVGEVAADLGFGIGRISSK